MSREDIHGIVNSGYDGKEGVSQPAPVRTISSYDRGSVQRSESPPPYIECEDRHQQHQQQYNRRPYGSGGQWKQETYPNSMPAGVHEADLQLPVAGSSSMLISQQPDLQYADRSVRMKYPAYPTMNPDSMTQQRSSSSADNQVGLSPQWKQWQQQQQPQQYAAQSPSLSGTNGGQQQQQQQQQLYYGQQSQLPQAPHSGSVIPGQINNNNLAISGNVVPQTYVLVQRTNGGCCRSPGSRRGCAIASIILISIKIIILVVYFTAFASRSSSRH